MADFATVWRLSANESGGGLLKVAKSPHEVLNALA
jgi:hypothetical protein